MGPAAPAAPQAELGRVRFVVDVRDKISTTNGLVALLLPLFHNAVFLYRRRTLLFYFCYAVPAFPRSGYITAGTAAHFAGRRGSERRARRTYTAIHVHIRIHRAGTWAAIRRTNAATPGAACARPLVPL